jgi:hypothetical protein
MNEPEPTPEQVLSRPLVCPDCGADGPGVVLHTTTDTGETLLFCGVCQYTWSPDERPVEEEVTEESVVIPPPDEAPLQTGDMIQAMAEANEESKDRAVIEMARNLPVFSDPKSLDDAKERIFGLGNSFAMSICTVGRILNWAKEQMPHGDFTEWLDDNFWFSRATAYRYMLFADKCVQEGHLLEYNSKVKATGSTTGAEGTVKKRVAAIESFISFVGRYWKAIESEFHGTNVITADERKRFLDTVDALYKVFIAAPPTNLK